MLLSDPCSQSVRLFVRKMTTGKTKVASDVPFYSDAYKYFHADSVPLS